jgi:hypothetical protein
MVSYRQSQHSRVALLDLPVEILDLIAKELGDHFGSLASLNVCNRLLYDISLRTLWKKLHLTDMSWRKVETDFQLTGSVPKAWGLIQ